MYRCECNKEFEKRQSFIAHQSNCIVHLGPEKYYRYKEIRKEQIRKVFLERKLNRLHICKICDKEYKLKDGYSNNFCSENCYLIHKEKHKKFTFKNNY